MLNSYRNNELSIMFRLKFRMVVSIIYSVCILLFFVVIYSRGSINSLGELETINVFLIIVFMMLSLVCLMESIYKYSTPVNAVFVRRYRIGFILQVLLLTTNSVLVMDNRISVQKEILFYALFGVIVTIVIGIHFFTINQYKKFNMSKKNDIIKNYHIQYNHDILERGKMVIQKSYYFLLYLIIVEIFFKYPIDNIITSFVFCVINIFVLFKFFNTVLIAYFGSKKGTIVLIFQAIANVVIYFFLYLCYEGKLDIHLLNSRTIDEISMVYILSYIPIYKYIIDIYWIGARMEEEWKI